MSCFICTDRQLSAVAAYAATQCFIRSVNAPSWGSEIDHARAIFRELAWKNLEAFVAVYSDRHRPIRCPEWDESIVRRRFENGDPAARLAFVKCVQSVRYQLSDAPEWDGSRLDALTLAVLNGAITELEGFDKSEGWNELP